MKKTRLFENFPVFILLFARLSDAVKRAYRSLRFASLVQGTFSRKSEKIRPKINFFPILFCSLLA